MQKPSRQRAGGASDCPAPRTTARGRKRSEQVALQIVENIAARQQEPGSKLPHESELLVEYEVSRSSLREALRLLEVQGLIRIRTGPGSGTEVGQIDPAHLSRTLGLYLIMARISLGELLDAWLTVEPMLARLAAHSADRERLEHLMKPFASQSSLSDTDIESGLAFHDAVAELAGNPVLTLILAAVGYLVAEQLRIASPTFAMTEASVHWHEKIADAILASDGDRAAAEMLAHLEDVKAEIQTIIPNLDVQVQLRR